MCITMVWSYNYIKIHKIREVVYLDMAEDRINYTKLINQIAITPLLLNIS